MSIFSRLKKPAPAETKPATDASAKGGGSSHSSPSSDSKDQEPPRTAEPPPAPKANGVHAAAPKPAAAPAPAATPAPAPAAAPAPKANGHVNGHAAAAVTAPSATAKHPDLSPTIANGTTPAPPRAPVERSVAASPFPPAAPVAIREPRRGSLDLAIALALDEPPVTTAHGTSTASDQAALQGTFEDLAVPYMAEVRSVMLELQWGEAQASWLELVRPVLRSFRKMAEPVGYTTLVEALDKFDAALAEVLAPGQPPTPSAAARDALLAAYAPLRTCLPRAFELEGERDRREPLIVRALLEQVPGLEPLMIEKMMAAGFGKLSALQAARADEIAAVTGIPEVVATATAARIQAFRRATPAGLASVDMAATVRELTRLLETLRAQNDAFETSARGWSDKDKTSKNQLRRDRQLSFLQITIELVRLGEVDLAQRLVKLPFAKKIDEVDRLISQAAVSAKAKNRIDARTTPGAAAAT